MQIPTNTFEPLICIKRIDETIDSATFEFQKLDNSQFEYKAGQFLTFEVDVAGELEYRAYSLSSSPSQSESVAVTIKRVPGGKVSNYLLDHLQAGIALPAMGPAGEFTLQDNPVTQDILLLCAGSGISPCISIALWLLETKQQVNIHFIYSAHTEKDVIMADKLAALEEQHEHFRLTLVLSKPENTNARQGRLDRKLFELLVPNNDAKTIFTCGPENYMQDIESIAESTGFDMSLFHKESFMPVSDKPVSDEPSVSYQIIAPQYGKNVKVESNQSLLSALEASGIPIIGACRTGVCGSCKCKVTGDVKSTSQATLTAEEIAQGYVLSCSSTIYSDLVVEL